MTFTLKKIAITIAFVLIVTIYGALDEEPVDQLTRIISVVTIVGSLAAVASRLFGASRTVYPLVSLVILYHVLAFAWPSFRGKLDPTFDVGAEIDRLAIFAISLGLASFLMGARLCQAANSGRAIGLRNFIADHAIGGVDRWFAFGLLLWLLQFAGGYLLADAVQLRAMFILFKSFGLSLVLASVFYARGIHPFKTVTAYVIFGCDLLLGVASGALAAPVFLFVQFFALQLYFKKRLSTSSWVILATAVFAIVALQQVKSDYRQRYWATSDSSTAFERVSAFLDIATSALFEPRSSDTIGLTESFESRADNFGTMKVVLSMTPETVPYYLGETLIPLLYTWIPRLIWIEKPQAQLGNSWAKEYGLLGADDFSTSFNLPWLVEFYMNFGFFGVFVGMLISGYLFQFAEKVFFDKVSQPYPYIVGVALMSRFWWLESNVSLTLGNLITQIVAVIVLSIAARGFLRRH